VAISDSFVSATNLSPLRMVFSSIYTKLKIDEGKILLCTTRVELIRSYQEHFWLMGNSFVKCVGVCEYVCVGTPYSLDVCTVEWRTDTLSTYTYALSNRF
jgi:hypothetical protein